MDGYWPLQRGLCSNPAPGDLLAGLVGGVRVRIAGISNTSSPSPARHDQSMSINGLLDVPLDDDEREVLRSGLLEWAPLAATHAVAMGFAGVDHLF